MTQCINIPIEVPVDLMLTLNQTEQEMKREFQLLIALMLFSEAKITLGKAIQFAGITR